jgi:hypothetical protein
MTPLYTDDFDPETLSGVTGSGITSSGFSSAYVKWLARSPYPLDSIAGGCDLDLDILLGMNDPGRQGKRCHCCGDKMPEGDTHWYCSTCRERRRLREIVLRPMRRVK